MEDWKVVKEVNLSLPVSLPPYLARQAAAAGEECPVPDLLQLCGGREEDNNSESQLFQQTCDDNTDTSIGSTS